jgi:hypothetical protein
VARHLQRTLPPECLAAPVFDLHRPDTAAARQTASPDRRVLRDIQHTFAHPTVFPLCTFGYALTRPAAYRLLNDIAAREADGGTMA